MKEFQALGLDISIINDQGENLQLKEIEDEEEQEMNNPNLDFDSSPAAPIENNSLAEEEDDDEEDTTTEEEEEETEGADL